jgi:glucosamine-6-phosphate deaminase
MFRTAGPLSGMSVIVFPDKGTASAEAASRIADIIRSAEKARGKAVIGLATGSTPEIVYARLVEYYRAGEISFKNVSSYNLDEYYPISSLDRNSYRSYMSRHLFSHVDIAPNRAHVLDGTIPEAFTARHAANFEEWIEADGGLDLQLLGIGRNGHIGFNEPSESTVEEALGLRTRVVELHPITRADAVNDFGSLDQVIPRAITMGVATILAARSIIMLATGAHKAEAVARALKGPISADVPASLLQYVAQKVTWILDEPAARGL